MANTFGLLLLAIVVAFICAQLMKDAKAFSRFLIVLLLGLVVGAGTKAIVNKMTKEVPEKTIVAPTKVTPTQDSIAYISNTTACLDPVSKEIVTRDRVEADIEGTPRTIDVAYADDS